MQLPSSPRDRWFGVGHSMAVDAAKAGAEAAAAAVAGRLPTVVFVSCSVQYDLPVLLDAIRVQAAAEAQPGDHVTIVGCSSSGQITPDGPSTESVAVTAWGGDGFAVSTRVGRGASGRLREVGVEVAACMAEVDRPHTALMLICDGLTGQQHEVVRGAYSLVGAAVPMVGGCAGDDLKYLKTYQFYGDADGVEVLSDTVIGMAIGSDAPLGIGIAHGWERSGPAMVVTSSSDGCIYELDGEPALDVYLRRLGIDEAVAADEEAFREAAFVYPLGLSRRSGEDIRVIHGADPKDRSLICLADVPQGALTWMMTSNRDSLVTGAGQSCAQAVSMLGDAPPLGVMAFDCAVRKVKLGPEGTRREIAEIAKTIGDVPFAGLYTNGEIARVRGALGMHHLTLVTLALA
jgi:hypothetical protein